MALATGDTPPSFVTQAGNPHNYRLIPFLISMETTIPIFTHLQPGSGSRRLPDTFDASASGAINVAISWACLNASVVKALTGSVGRGSLFNATSDICLFTNEIETCKEGASLGACVALALCGHLINQPHDDNRLIGVSAVMDLRGHLSRVGGLYEKARQAHQRGLSVVVVSSEDQELLERESPPSLTGR